MTNRVSVVIPIYNADSYLSSALDSVLNQSYQDFEVIAVDDGSTDHSREILASYGSRITLISQTNKGPSGARNTGIRCAKGEYIAFLDADDIWLSTKLEKQMLFLGQNPQVDFVYTEYFMINSAGGLIKTIRFNEIVDQRILVNSMLIRNVMSGANSSSVMKKKCFDKVGYFDENMKGCEDRDMWIRIARTCTVRVLHEPLFQYRFHPNNAHKNIHIMLKGQKRFLQKNAAYAGWYIRRKAYGYMYLDAARECAAIAKHSQTVFNALKSCMYYPLKLYESDDKYQILLKALFPRIIKNMTLYLRKWSTKE